MPNSIESLQELACRHLRHNTEVIGQLSGQQIFLAGLSTAEERIEAVRSYTSPRDLEQAIKAVFIAAFGPMTDIQWRGKTLVGEQGNVFLQLLLTTPGTEMNILRAVKQEVIHARDTCQAYLDLLKMAKDGAGPLLEVQKTGSPMKKIGYGI